MGLPETLDALLSGPGRLRFIVQPLLAVLLGIRDGRRDADAARPPYVVSVLFANEFRRESLMSGLATLTRPLVVAVIVDMAAHYLIFRSVRLWHAVVFGAALIALPYVVTRALTNRIRQKRMEGRGDLPL